jgi:hypothetical protein
MVGIKMGLGNFMFQRENFGFGVLEEVLDGHLLVQKGGLKEGRKYNLLLLLQNWIRTFHF